MSRDRGNPNHRHAERLRRMRDPRQGLRLVERYVQDIVAAKPTPPRTFKAGYVIRQQIYTRTKIAVLLILVFFVVISFFYSVRSYHDPVNTLRYLLSSALLAIGLLGVLWTQLLEPMYRWWQAVRYGRYVTAQVVHVEQRRLHYGDVIEGIWRFGFGREGGEARFRLDNDESGHWIWRIEADDRIHVLLHPRKLKVLIAIGPVEPESPELTKQNTDSIIKKA